MDAVLAHMTFCIDILRLNDRRRYFQRQIFSYRLVDNDHGEFRLRDDFRLESGVNCRQIMIYPFFFMLIFMN